MNRPWKIWAISVLCLAVLFGAMGWVSLTALGLHGRQGQMQQQAEVEEKVRLALWRLDSMLAPLVIQESARPYFVYQPYYAPNRVYSQMFDAARPDEPLAPSPLLVQVSSNVLLHFQLSSSGELQSPQVPGTAQQGRQDAGPKERVELASRRLQQFRQILQAPAALAGMAGNPPGSWRAPVGGLRGSGQMDSAQMRSGKTKGGQALVPVNRDLLWTNSPAPQPGANPEANFPIYAQVPQASVQAQPQGKGMSQQDQFVQEQAYRNQAEMQKRAQTYQQVFAENVKNAQMNALYVPNARVVEGAAGAIWFGNALVLARRVSVQGNEYVQGCWLDWDGLREWLLAGIKDLLPSARLVPVENAGAIQPQGRLLASLPVRLIPGAAPWTGGYGGSSSPIVLALLAAWFCMVLAVLAVAVLLHGAISLSERRGAFVSAVTHELRTPLTTFKMYSEMLAEGMVPDPGRQADYLRTLCSEANRLSHLVENVLAYARLERGNARSRIEKLSLDQLVERVQPRLAERARQVDAELVVDGGEEGMKAVVQVDVAAVEQILFNLVDNACKYGMSHGKEKLIHLEAFPEGKNAMVRVRDHGQGITAEGARRLFKPFCKSANEAANSAPGIGLGLALCRRLSRSMGGDLRLDSVVKDGACFVLRLPLSRVDGMTPTEASLG